MFLGGRGEGAFKANTMVQAKEAIAEEVGLGKKPFKRAYHKVKGLRMGFQALQKGLIQTRDPMNNLSPVVCNVFIYP
jgi:hypothetical protein